VAARANNANPTRRRPPAGGSLAANRVRIHPTAIVEPGVEIGAGTTVWDNVHVRGPARIGRDCIVGEKTYVAYGVTVGDLVKINSHVYICTGVTIEDRVMIAAGVIFTNDRYPRAFDDGGGLADSGPTDETLCTVVRSGATIGAGAVVGPGIDVGAFAMVGMGSVVAKDVPAHGLVYGNPARLRGYVCICGAPLIHLNGETKRHRAGCCSRCRRSYRVLEHDNGILRLRFGVRSTSDGEGRQERLAAARS
jgi:UDP-2-acetamido-3-amino-2,3-dideoxy-glucuronate N-acetyltransferase